MPITITLPHNEWDALIHDLPAGEPGTPSDAGLARIHARRRARALESIEDALEAERRSIDKLTGETVRESNQRPFESALEQYRMDEHQ